MNFVIIGSGLIAVWLTNWIWMLWKILTTLDNIDDGDTYFEQLLKNSSESEMNFLKIIAETNPYLFVAGILMVTVGLMF